MHSNTAEFASAIRNRNRQHALIVFPSSHVYLTDRDIDADGGIQLMEMLNSDEEMTMGRAVSAEIDMALFNRGDMDEIDFTEEFEVYLGTELPSRSWADVSKVASGATQVLIVDMMGTPAVISTNPAWKTLTCNGVSYTLSGNPRAMVCEEDILYVIGEGGALLDTFTVSGGNLVTNINDDVGAFMRGKMASWALEGAYITYADDVVRRFKLAMTGGTWSDLSGSTWDSLSEKVWDNAADSGAAISYVETQYVPIGVFSGERPDKVHTQTINLLGYDRMSRFDEDATEFLAGLTFPMTLKQMFEAVCAYVGVSPSYANGRTFINSGKTFTGPPQRAEGTTTCRDVLRWIAEASCAYARMTRTGECELTWFGETDYQLTRRDRFGLNIAEYDVPVPDKLCVHVTEKDIGVILPQVDTFTGDGSTKTFALTDASVKAPAVTINNAPTYAFTFNQASRTITFAQAPASGAAIVVNPASTNTNAYDIVDNPYLYGSSDAEVRAYARNIYNHLITMSPVHSPMTVEAECNWAVQAGDIIEVEDDNGVMRRMPIYAQTIMWNGHAEVVYESTGSRKRGTMSAANREKLASGYSKLEIIKTINELTAEMYTYDPNTGEKVSKYTQLAGEIDMMVRNDEIISAINLSKEGIKIKAPMIEFNGAVITNGTLKTGNWVFDSSGAKYSNGGTNVNMTVMSGDFVGGGTAIRAFYGSSNCDVQYGADYGYNTFIRSKAITIVAHNNGDMSDYRMGSFSKYPGPKDYEDFTFYCNESESDSPAGNLGYAEQPWDTIYVNKCFRLSESTFSSRYVKHDVEELPEMGDLLDRLVPVSFKYNFKHVKDQVRYGLILEDAVKVLPVICNVPDYEEGSAEYTSEATIMYSDLIAPMLREIQSLRRRVAALEGE